MMPRQLNIHMLKKWNLDLDLVLFKNSECMTCPNIKIKSIKLLEDNKGENLNDLGFIDDFFRYNTKDMIYEKILNKLDFFKIKTFHLLVKDNVKRMRRLHRLGECICRKHF